jgi:hypothetical protein
MLKTSMAAPWEVVVEIWEHQPSTQKMSMVSPMGCDAGDPGAPTINTKSIDGGPPSLQGEGLVSIRDLKGVL